MAQLSLHPRRQQIRGAEPEETTLSLHPRAGDIGEREAVQPLPELLPAHEPSFKRPSPTTVLGEPKVAPVRPEEQTGRGVFQQVKEFLLGTPEERARVQAEEARNRPRFIGEPRVLRGGLVSQREISPEELEGRAPEVIPGTGVRFGEPIVDLAKELPQAVKKARADLPAAPRPIQQARALVGQAEPPEIVERDLPLGGVVTGAARFASGLTTPENVALLATLGLTSQALPTLSRLVSAGFSGQMIGNAISRSPELKERMEAGDDQGAAEILTEMVLEAGLGAAAGRHALTRRAPAARIERSAEAQPEPRVRPIREERVEPVAPAEPPIPEQAMPGLAELPEGRTPARPRIETREPGPPPLSEAEIRRRLRETAEERSLTTEDVLADVLEQGAHRLREAARGERERAEGLPAEERRVEVRPARERPIPEEFREPRRPLSPEEVMRLLEEERPERLELREEPRPSGLTPERAGLSQEELARRETFYKTDGVTTYLGKQPDAPLREGEAIVGVSPEGRLRVVESKMPLSDAEVVERVEPKLNRMREPARPEVRRQREGERVLPGMERAVEEQRAAVERFRGEELTREFEQPLESVEARAGEMERRAPLFREAEAGGQREIFREPRVQPEPRAERTGPTVKPERARLLPKDAQVFDRYGDRLVPGRNATDPLGKRVKVQGFVETPEGTIRAIVQRGKQREEIAADSLTARPAARERKGAAPAGRYFGESEMAYAERLLTESGRPPGEGQLYSNPTFDPRFWERADRALQPLMKRMDQGIERAIGKLPFSLRRWLREEPRTKEIIQQARLEVGQRQSETEAALRMVTRENPTPEELLMADRIARGVPEDLSPARAELRAPIREAAERAHGLAQQMTAERSALGLPIRQEWAEGPKHWYPNLWEQHLFKPRMVAGRLFSMFRGRGGLKPPTAAERGSLKRRTTDRWAVVDEKGNLARTKGGEFAVFDSPEAAQGFLDAHPRRHLRVLEPMTHEQAVAHGLIENLALNLRVGFGKEWALLAKTRALETIGREFAVDTRHPGYRSLGEMGFNIPADLAKRNPHIARLRDGYLPQDVAETLTAYYGKQGIFPSWLRALEGSLRKWVTVRSPFRHPRQLMENHLALAFADPRAALNVPAMGRSFRDFARGARGEEGVPYWQEYRNSPLWNSDIVRGEFETVWRGVDQVKPGNAPLSLAERLAMWAETNPAARKLMASDRFAERLYRAEDQVYKYYLYRTLRERGLAPEQAEYRARRSFFDYGDVPPIVRSANRYIPFAPNVLYQFSRILGTGLRDRPATTSMKLALLLYGYAFMRNELMERAGITKQDEKNMGKLAPAWHELVLPLTDSKGQNIKVSILWLIPFGEAFFLSDLLAEEEDTERGFFAAGRKFMPMSVQPLATAISQRGPFGQKVLRGTESKGEAAGKLAREMLKGYLPGILGQYWLRLYENATAGEERRQPLLEEALLERIAGRIEHFTPEEKVNLRKALTAGRARKLQEEAYRQRGRFIRGTTRGETFREEVGRLRERTAGEGYAHPETLAVAQAIEEGRFDEARQLYRELKASGFYASGEEAKQAIRDLLNRRERLREMETDPLPQAREVTAQVVEEFRETGRISRASRQQLRQALSLLTESDQKALAEWLELQISSIQAQTARQQRNRDLGEPRVRPERIQ